MKVLWCSGDVMISRTSIDFLLVLIHVLIQYYFIVCKVDWYVSPLVWINKRQDSKGAWWAKIPPSNYECNDIDSVPVTKDLIFSFAFCVWLTWNFQVEYQNLKVWLYLLFVSRKDDSNPEKIWFRKTYLCCKITYRYLPWEWHCIWHRPWTTIQRRCPWSTSQHLPGPKHETMQLIRNRILDSLLWCGWDEKKSCRSQQARSLIFSGPQSGSPAGWSHWHKDEQQARHHESVWSSDPATSPHIPI